MTGSVVTIGPASQPADAVDVDPRLFGPGIYHLLEHGRVVYVGATSNLAQRISAWRSAAWFGSVRIIPADLDSLPELEREHIQRYRPEHNSAGVSAPYMSPAHHWREKRRFETTHNPGERFHSRVQYVRALRVDLSLSLLSGLRLFPSNLKAVEKMYVLSRLGFPPPDYAKEHGGKEYPRWMTSTVLRWLDEHGPFEDEIEEAAA